MTPRRRLRAVPEPRAPRIIDPTMPPEHQSDEWQEGWRACREVLADEWEAWYRRGLENNTDAGDGVIALGLGAISGAIVGFIAGFVAAVAWFG